MFKIVFTYAGGNNFYLDNVRAGDGVASGINNPLASEIGFLVYPNPVSGTASITYALKETQDVQIKLFDMLGKEVGTLYNGIQLAGNQSIVLDKARLNLNSGVYFVKMMVDNNSLTQKIVIE